MKKKGIIILVAAIVVILCVVLGILLFGKSDKVIYEVTFDSNGGTKIDSQLVVEGETASIPVDPKKEGHSFLYWSYNNKEFDFTTKITEDITLLAKYEINEYVITFNSNGGSSVDGQIVKYNTKIGKPDDPTKTGYEFLYWMYDNKEYDFNTLVTKNMELVAVWSEVTHTVSFDCDGGSIVTPKTVQSGSTLTKPANPVKYGYKFLYWTYNDKEFDFSTPITKNITLKAKWQVDVIKGTDGVKYKIDESTNTCKVTGYYGDSTEVVIANFYHDVPVTSIDDYAFKDAKDVKKIIIHDGIKKIGRGAFYGCNSLEEVNIPYGVITLEDDLFSYCYSLKEFIIPENITEIGEFTFFKCTSLVNIQIPESVTRIYESAFAECTTLETIIIPDSVTIIGGNVFSGCTKLKNVTLPANLTSLSGNMFTNCTSLKTITLPSTVTEIKEYAFYGCTNLEKIILPSGLTTIRNQAFNNCVNLKEIIIPNATTIMEDNIFFNCTNLKIYCYASSKPKTWSHTWNISKCPVVWGYNE